MFYLSVYKRFLQLEQFILITHTKSIVYTIQVKHVLGTCSPLDLTDSVGVRTTIVGYRPAKHPHISDQNRFTFIWGTEKDKFLAFAKETGDCQIQSATGTPGYPATQKLR